ncbi:hypothetical protein JKF63_05405 [Porcisia hertigi]|uniref:Uncharacterized protein n=1 Tax=Porcisia hertigi TaxID=2761500 RepID=A0A836IVW6_9TRYP|nr:hypothetical protein JKF63_05405 [Porcisia hertigi]
MTTLSLAPELRVPSQLRPARQHAFLVFLTSMFFLSLITIPGHAVDAEDGLHSAPDACTECSFSLPTASALLDVLASGCCGAEGKAEGSRSASSALPLPTHPVLILFSDKSIPNSLTLDALRAKVRQIKTDVPLSVLRVHEYEIPIGARERRLMELLLRGVDRLPALVLFPGRVAKVQVAPGAIISANPFQVPVHYSTKPLTSASYSELRSWALSELPARYIDPVTFHLIPSLQFVFRHVEVHDTLRLVRDAVQMNASRSLLPGLVSMAYVRLTRHGSEEVLAALSSVATQAGNAVLTLVTESTEVAAAWGLHTENTLAMTSWASALSAYVDGVAFAGIPTRISDASSPQPIRTVSELTEVTAASAAWRTAFAASDEAGVSQLQAWREAMNAFNNTNPLRKIESAAHLLHELTALQGAIKVVFVLRESDDMWFHHHLDVAAALSQRLRYTTVRYNTTEFEKGSKVRTRLERAWTPARRYEVFWLDGEQLPALADALHVSQVPSILILVPLQSRFRNRDAVDNDVLSDTAGDGQSDAGASEGKGLRSRDPLIGIHTINRNDIFRAAYMDDAQMAQNPVSGKDALPLFPRDSDAILRFLASSGFVGAVQHTMSSTRLSALRQKVSEWRDALHASAASSGISNRRYLQLDHRYYPLRAAEEPVEGPAYVRQILNGSSPLPAFDNDDSDAMAGQRHASGWSATRLQGTTTASSSKADQQTQHKVEREAAAHLKMKAAEWEAELAKRRQEKERRMRRKAAENEAVRAEQQRVFLQEVDAALKAGEEEEEEVATSAGPGVSARPVFQQGGLLVRRPTMNSVSGSTPQEGSGTVRSRATSGQEDSEDVALRRRQQRRHQEYREWRADRQRMVKRCVRVSETYELSVISEWE